MERLRNILEKRWSSVAGIWRQNKLIAAIVFILIVFVVVIEEITKAEITNFLKPKLSGWGSAMFDAVSNSPFTPFGLAVLLFLIATIIIAFIYRQLNPYRKEQVICDRQHLTPEDGRLITMANNIIREDREKPNYYLKLKVIRVNMNLDDDALPHIEFVFELESYSPVHIRIGQQISGYISSDDTEVIGDTPKIYPLVQGLSRKLELNRGDNEQLCLRQNITLELRDKWRRRVVQESAIRRTDILFIFDNLYVSVERFVFGTSQVDGNPFQLSFPAPVSGKYRKPENSDWSQYDISSLQVPDIQHGQPQ